MPPSNDSRYGGLGGVACHPPAAQTKVLAYSFTEISPPGNAPGNFVGLFNYGLNDLGQVVGGMKTAWVMSTATSTRAGNMSLSNYFEGRRAPAFVESKGVFPVIKDPAAGPGGFTNALGINDRGQIVGDYCDSSGNNCHGFLDTNGHFTTIEDPNAPPGSTFPDLINNVGQIFGTYFDSAGNSPHFLATPNFRTPNVLYFGLLKKSRL